MFFYDEDREEIRRRFNHLDIDINTTLSITHDISNNLLDVKNDVLTCKSRVHDNSQFVKILTEAVQELRTEVRALKDELKAHKPAIRPAIRKKVPKNV